MNRGRNYPMALIGYRLMMQQYDWPFWIPERYALWGRIYADPFDPGTIIGVEGEIVATPVWDGTGDFEYWTSASVVSGHSIRMAWQLHQDPVAMQPQQRIAIEVDAAIVSTQPWGGHRQQIWFAQSVSIPGAVMGVPPAVPGYRGTLLHAAIKWDGTPVDH